MITQKIIVFVHNKYVCTAVLWHDNNEYYVVIIVLCRVFCVKNIIQK